MILAILIKVKQCHTAFSVTSLYRISLSTTNCNWLPASLRYRIDGRTHTTHQFDLI